MPTKTKASVEAAEQPKLPKSEPAEGLQPPGLYMPGVFEDTSNVARREDSGGWLPATDAPPGHAETEESRKPLEYRRSVGPRDAPSQRELRPASRSSRHSLFAKDDTIQQRDGRAFVYGTGTNGPNAEARLDDSMRDRSAKADHTLSAKQRDKIRKDEVRNSKQFVRVIREESRVEKGVLSIAVKELAELQEVQKGTLKREARVHSNHIATLAAFQRQELEYLAARRKCENLQSEMQAQVDELNTLRSAAQETTERMQEKTREIESLRQALDLDEREREAKIAQLTGSKPKDKTKDKSDMKNGDQRKEKPAEAGTQRKGGFIRKRKDSSDVPAPNAQTQPTEYTQPGGQAEYTGQPQHTAQPQYRDVGQPQYPAQPAPAGQLHPAAQLQRTAQPQPAARSQLVENPQISTAHGGNPAPDYQRAVVATNVDGGSLVDDSSDEAAERPLVTEYINLRYTDLGKGNIAVSPDTAYVAAGGTVPMAPPPITSVRGYDDANFVAVSTSEGRRKSERGPHAGQAEHWWKRKA